MVHQQGEICRAKEISKWLTNDLVRARRGEKLTKCCVFYVIGRLLLGGKQGNGHGRRKFGELEDC